MNIIALFPALLLFLPSIAIAHTVHGSTNGVANGFYHPLGGWDHLLAMLAVGLWAAQIGRHAIYVVPISFIGVMALAGVVGAAGISLPFVEQGILASIVILGLLVASAAKFPVLAAAVIVGLFAFFHGHAHGTEMPTMASGIGFMIATVLLHSLGIGLGLIARKIMNQPTMIQATGFSIAMLGTCLCFV